MGIGVVLLAEDKRKEISEFLGDGTNNIAELTAIQRGLEAIRSPARPVRVYTDSSYSIGVLSKGWKAKANQALIATIKQDMLRFPNLTFVKVSGHAGVVENERCDELARNAITDRR
jgi:ribonuclease HI